MRQVREVSHTSMGFMLPIVDRNFNLDILNLGYHILVKYAGKIQNAVIG